jgi:hypothetical protein
VSAAAGGGRNLELFVEMAMVADVDLGRSYFFPQSSSYMRRSFFAPTERGP